MMKTDNPFIHKYIPGQEEGGPTLLLLHGTGGNENDLIPFAHKLAPKAGILAVRGKVLENGMPRFFRRLAEGVFDLDDLVFRANELADFIQTASKVYKFDLNRVVAIGYSNGANIAAAILFLRPDTLAGAVLLHAQVPLVPEELPDLGCTSVFLSAGENDPIVPREESERLSRLFRSARADITEFWHPGGHEITPEEIAAAKKWLQEHNVT